MRKHPGSIPVMMFLLMLLYITPAAADSLELPEIEPGVTSMADNTVKVPDLYRIKKQEALLILEQAGLHPVVKDKMNMNFDLVGMECRVLSQIPLPGEQVEPGSAVILHIYVPVGSCEAPPGRES